MTKLLCFTTVSVLASCVIDQEGEELGSTALEVTIQPGQATCAALEIGTHEVRFEAPVNGVYQLDAVNTVTFQYYDATGTVFFFTGSTLRLDGVLVEANATTTAWDLDEANGWPSLGAIGNGQWLVPDAVSFCFDYELFLNPNAYGHRGERHDWDITKTGGAEPILLAAGGSALAQYTVTVTPVATIEEAMYFAGPVFVNNPSPLVAPIDAVTVMVGEIEATVTCPVALPTIVQPFSILTCEFIATVPDEDDRVVFVDVVSDGTLGIDRALDVASMSSHTTSFVELDECVAVYDDHAPNPSDLLGITCIPATFTYTVPIGPFAECGPFTIENTAWFDGLDTGASETATWQVGGDVACDDGCTRTQGYWKNHAEHGAWALLGGTSTPFFLSGASYMQVLDTPPAGGNAYYILAHQYIAARLNQLAGAQLGLATWAFAESTTLLQSHTPAQLSQKNQILLRLRFILLALILDAYNNGWIGPGHCDGPTSGCDD